MAKKYKFYNEKVNTLKVPEMVNDIDKKTEYRFVDYEFDKKISENIYRYKLVE